MKNGETLVHPLQNHNGTILQKGLTKREYFAGLAMQGLLANRSFSDQPDSAIVKFSISITDELLKQLENETTK